MSHNSLKDCLQLDGETLVRAPALDWPMERVADLKITLKWLLNRKETTQRWYQRETACPKSLMWLLWSFIMFSCLLDLHINQVYFYHRHDFHFHATEKEMATHSSVLAWRIPGTGEPGGLPSVGSHRVGHDWSNLAAAAGGASGKESICNAGDIRDMGSIPGSGRSPGGEHGNPLQYSCLENPMDRGAWQATVLGVAELHMTEQLRAARL